MATTDKQATDNGRKAGAPKGNANAIRHGLHAGKLPKKLQYVELKVNAFRRILESEVLAAKKLISLVDAATINTACKWDRHGRLAEYWLRHEEDSMSAGDRLKFSEAIGKASDNRDKAIYRLGLDRDTNADVIDALYRKPKVTNDESA